MARIRTMDVNSPEIEYGEEPEQVKKLLQECNLQTAVEEKGKQVLLPQIVAAIIAMSNSIVIGKILGYSAVLIPQMLDDYNGTQNFNSTEVKFGTTKVFESDISWIASALLAVVLPTSLMGGLLIDSFGRLNIIKLSAIPHAVGWIIIATAKSIQMIILGRILTGTAIALVVSSTTVYVTEISSPRIRGTLASFSICLISLGILLVYLEGSFFKWSTVAWTSVVYIIVPNVISHCLLPESPVWLVSKNRIEQARRSLLWLNGERTSRDNHLPSITEIQLSDLIKSHRLKQEKCEKEEDSLFKNLRMLSRPTAYKPFVIIGMLFIFQQLSGTFAIIFYAVSFFKEIGTNMSAYLAAVLVGLVRFFMTLVILFLMKKYGRRHLMLCSTMGMCISMAISGLFTALIKENKTTMSWIPVSMVLLYVASSVIGVVNIPWAMMSEIFPLQIRGIATGLCLGFGYLLMFAVIRLYYPLTRLLGGLAHLQYFFAVVSFLTLLYSYIFLPETYNKELSDIEEYFQQYWTHISFRRSESKVENNKELSTDVV